MLTEKVDELINDWVYIQDICKNPARVVINITGNVQYGEAKPRSLPWPKLLSVAPICRCPGPSPSPITLPLSFPEADPMQARLGGVFQPHQPNCSSFPAHKWYKVQSCPSQCPYFNHLSTLIDTNGFYKCKSLSSSKLHVFEEAIEKSKFPVPLASREMFSKYPESRGRT